MTTALKMSKNVRLVKRLGAPANPKDGSRVLVDDNGIRSFVDDNSVTSFIDDLGRTLS